MFDVITAAGRRLSIAVPFVVLAACSDQSPSGPAPFMVAAVTGVTDNVDVCHMSGSPAHIISVGMPALRAHLAHGDYIAGLKVVPSVAPGDGVHFARITDAVRAARAVRVARNEQHAGACRITIDVAAGTYTGSFDAGAAPALELFPLLIDVPDITLRGALQMQLDAQGRATGTGVSADVSSLVPDRVTVFLPVSEALIVVAGHPGGFAGDGVVVEGFDFHTGGGPAVPAGIGITVLRVQDLVVRGNRFEPGFATSVDFRASTALAEQNFATGGANNCTMCLAGPGNYEASGNRLTNGSTGGIFVTAVLGVLPFSLGAAPVAPVEPWVVPATAAVTADIHNNDLRGFVSLPTGFGLRVTALGRLTSQVPQATTVFASDNDLVGNAFGLIVDAGFPTAGTLLRGDIGVTLAGNTISGSCQNDLLVAFTRHTGALKLTSNPFLVGSSFTLDLGTDLNWADAWYAHSAGLGNTLVVNGATIPTGSFEAYDPTRACP